MRLPEQVEKQFYTVTSDKKVQSDGMSVIITIRGESRLNQLYQCINWCLNQTLTPIEIMVVEHGPFKVAKLEQFGSLVKHLYIEDKGHFCKSACYNLGVSNAQYPYICGIDADLLMPSNFLEEGYKQLQTSDACFLANDICYIGGSMQNMFDINFTGKTWLTHRANWQFHGGSFFIHKQKYFDIGGHDEFFKGHGSEDSEFYKRVHDTLKTSTGTACLLHVEHGRDKSDFDNIMINEGHLFAVQRIPLAVRIQQLKKSNVYLADVPSSTVIPNVIPDTMEEYTTRIQEAQQLENVYRQRRQQMANTQVHNQREAQRRRVMGF